MLTLGKTNLQLCMWGLGRYGFAVLSEIVVLKMKMDA